MTEMKPQLHHVDFMEDLRRQVIERANDVSAMMASFDEEHRGPMLIRARFEFSAVPKWPAGPVGPIPFDTQLKRATEWHRGFITSLYYEIVPPRKDSSAYMDYPWTFFGFDPSISNDNGQPTFDKFGANHAMFVPRSQEFRFKDVLSRVHPRSGFSPGGISLEDIQMQEIENSEEDIAVAVEHILKFAASWPPIVDRDDLNVFVSMFAHLDLIR
jgi:hypothetical protein